MITRALDRCGSHSICFEVSKAGSYGAYYYIVVNMNSTESIYFALSRCHASVVAFN